MDDNQIDRILHHHPCTKYSFLGVFGCDMLPKLVTRNRPVCLVANLSKILSTGTHWIAIYLHKDGTGEYFDSFGRSPAKVFKDFMNKNARNGWVYNERKLQSLISTVCGGYCIIYLIRRCQNDSINQGYFVNKLFPISNQAWENDVQVIDAMKRRFNMDIPFIDLDMYKNRMN